MDRTLDDILLDFGERYGFPIVTNLDIGHTAPIATMPIGIMAEMDGEGESFRITESAVW